MEKYTFNKHPSLSYNEQTWQLVVRSLNWECKAQPRLLLLLTRKGSAQCAPNCLMVNVVSQQFSQTLVKNTDFIISLAMGCKFQNVLLLSTTNTITIEWQKILPGVNCPFKQNHFFQLNCYLTENKFHFFFNRHGLSMWQRWDISTKVTLCPRWLCLCSYNFYWICFHR